MEYDERALTVAQLERRRDILAAEAKQRVKEIEEIEAERERLRREADRLRSQVIVESSESVIGGPA